MKNKSMKERLDKALEYYDTGNSRKNPEAEKAMNRLLKQQRPPYQVRTIL